MSTETFLATLAFPEGHVALVHVQRWARERSVLVPLAERDRFLVAMRRGDLLQDDAGVSCLVATVASDVREHEGVHVVRVELQRRRAPEADAHLQADAAGPAAACEAPR